MPLAKALLIVGIGLCAALAAQADTLRVATFNFPPFQYEELGEIKGVTTELIREIFKRMNQPIEMATYPFPRALKTIRDGSSDILFTCYYLKDREHFVTYSREPLIHQTIALFVLKDSTIVFDGNLAKLAGHSFGLVRFSYGKTLDAAISNKTIAKTDYVSDMENNFKKFIKGRFEILPSDRWVARYYQEQIAPKGVSLIKELRPTIESFPAYIGYSKTNHLEALRDRVDETLREMKKDGTYQTIIDTHARRWAREPPLTQ